MNKIVYIFTMKFFLHSKMESKKNAKMRVGLVALRLPYKWAQKIAWLNYKFVGILRIYLLHDLDLIQQYYYMTKLNRDPN